MPLPPTAAARRNARLRAAALATIPLILFVVAAAPRVWAPDLVPYGGRQAAYVGEAVRRAPDSWAALYGNPWLPALALADPLLRDLPSPVATWVVLRGLIDAVGVALLFLAARRLVGAFGATLAALLYAASPAAWAAARDPAGPFGSALAAATLLTAVRLVERQTLLRGAVFGVLLGLLARSVPPGLFVVVLGAATLAIGRVSWQVGGLAALGLVLSTGPSLVAGQHHLAADLIGSFDALRMPGWLVLGIGYRPFDGYAPGATLLFDIELPVVLLTVLLALAAAGVAVWAARRGRPLLLLAPIWAMVSWVMAVAVLDPLAHQFLGIIPIGAMLDVAMPVAALPPFVLLVACLTVARHAAVRWSGLAGIGLLLAAEVTTLGLSVRSVEQVARERSAFVMRPRRDLTERPAGATVSLRDWKAVTDTMREVAQRIGTDEILVFDDNPTADVVRWPGGLLRGNVRARFRPAEVVLPLERETAYLIPSGIGLPRELERPSSTTTIFTPTGTDTGARIVTLRPRTAADWLARVRAVPDGRFADGTALVGVVTDQRAEGRLDLTVYLELPVAADGRAVGERLRIATRATPSQAWPELLLASASARRHRELLVQSFLPVSLAGENEDGVLLVSLLDASGRLIRTVAGEEAIGVALGVQ